jgi:hypothetical protein
MPISTLGNMHSRYAGYCRKQRALADADGWLKKNRITSVGAGPDAKNARQASPIRNTFGAGTLVMRVLLGIRGALRAVGTRRGSVGTRSGSGHAPRVEAIRLWE